MWDYSEKVKEHFYDPKNAGAVADANATGDVGSLSCGDALRLTLKVDPETDIILDAGFQTFGCGSAIASSSALTEMIKGLHVDEALKISNQDIADYLDGLPPEKMHCSVMGREALQAAVANYRGEELEDDHEEGALVCKCFAIDEVMVRDTVRANNLSSVEEVTNYTKAGGGCSSCHEAIENILTEEMAARGETFVAPPIAASKKKKVVKLKPEEPKPEPAAAPAPAAAKPSGKLTTVQRIKIIENALAEIRPTLQRDHGDVELLDVDGKNIYVKLIGACVGCQLATATVGGIQQKLMEALGEFVKVTPVTEEQLTNLVGCNMNDIYMDNNATTMVDPAVVDEMLPFFTEQFGNPSSLHSFGNKVGFALKKARKTVQTLLGAEHDSEIIFTSCGTEADSTAILSALRAQPERKEIITTEVEHPAILNLCENLETQGYTVHYLKVDEKGRLDLNAYQKLLTDQVAIASIMWANNETGTIFPVEKMAEMAQEEGIMFHTDAVQAVGKLPINLQDSAIHMLSLSGHKLHAPKGIGVLYLKRGTRFRPLLRGGHQERGRRAGTENAAAIVGLGKAAQLAMDNMAHENSYVKNLRDKLQEGILKTVPNCFVTGDPENRLPNTVNIAFEYIEGEAILLLMNKHGIAASSGSACTSGSLEPSHVMKAMGIPYTAAHGTVRFSLSRYNTEEEVNRVIEAVPPIVAKLRKLSPYWDAEANAPMEEPEKSFAPVYA